MCVEQNGFGWFYGSEEKAVNAEIAERIRKQLRVDSVVGNKEYQITLSQMQKANQGDVWNK